MSQFPPTPEQQLILGLMRVLALAFVLLACGAAHPSSSPPTAPPMPAATRASAPVPVVAPTPTPAPTVAPTAESAPVVVPAPPAPAPPALAPPAPAPRPAPPAIVIGSTQQVLINSDRANAGLGALNWSSCLAGIAYQNALRMANQGYISHTNGPSADLGCGLGNQAGENVGEWGGGINDSAINQLFMASAPHRANILGPYHYVGTAWVVSGGKGYIAVEFG